MTDAAAAIVSVRQSLANVGSKARLKRRVGSSMFFLQSLAVPRYRTWKEMGNLCRDWLGKRRCGGIS